MSERSERTISTVRLSARRGDCSLRAAQGCADEQPREHSGDGVEPAHQAHADRARHRPRLRRGDHRVRHRRHRAAVARRLVGPARGLRQHPVGVEGRVLHAPADPHRLRGGAVLAAREELGAGPARQPGDDEEEHRPPAEGLPGRRLHADAAARPRGGRHALAHLLQLRDPARGHDGARDQPPDARERQVPPRRRVQGLRAGRRRGRRAVPRRRDLGDRPSLRPAAVPHPHQVQARARRHPRHVPRHRRHRLRCRGLPHRPRRPARLREVVGRRLPAVGPGRRQRQPGRVAPGLVDRPRVHVLRVRRDPADHHAAPHLHVAAQHVPA